MAILPGKYLCHLGSQFPVIFILSILIRKANTLFKQVGWIGHRVLWAMPHPLTLTASQRVLKPKFLQLGCP